jgi:hypothetical protein
MRAGGELEEIRCTGCDVLIEIISKTANGGVRIAEPDDRAQPRAAGDAAERLEHSGLQNTV